MHGLSEPILLVPATKVNLFHKSQLVPAAPPPPPPTQWLASSTLAKGSQYLVERGGYSEEERSWDPAWHIVDLDFIRFLLATSSTIGLDSKDNLLLTLLKPLDSLSEEIDLACGKDLTVFSCCPSHQNQQLFTNITIFMVIGLSFQFWLVYFKNHQFVVLQGFV